MIAMDRGPTMSSFHSSSKDDKWAAPLCQQNPQYAECSPVHAGKLNFAPHWKSMGTVCSRCEDNSIATQVFWGRIPAEPLQRWHIERKLKSTVLVHRTTKEVFWDAGCVETSLGGSRASHLKARFTENMSAFGSIPSSGTLSQLSYEELLNEALQARDLKDQQSVHAFTRVILSLLEWCIDKKDLTAGREVHDLVVRNGLESNAFLGCHLIRMFAFFEMLEEAEQVFDKLSKQSVFSWTAMISAHTKLGKNEQAIKLYHQLEKSGVEPDGYTFVAILKACDTAAALTQSKLIHAHIIASGFESQIYVANTLIDMYAKCGRLQDACMLFERIPTQDIVTWNAMLTGYGQHGYGQEALHLFKRMEQEGMESSVVTFICVLKACASIEALDQGKQIHNHIIESGLELDLSVSTALVDMYAKCRSLHNAGIVFERLHRRDVVTWSALIAAYAQHGQGHGHYALKLFEQMQYEGVMPNQATFVCVLKACSSVEALEQGKRIHALSIESGFELNVFLDSTLIDMYVRGGNLDDAWRVFERLPKQDVVMWNSMIGGFAQCGHGQKALQLFYQMEQQGMEPDKVTSFCVLKACSSLSALEQGKQIHSRLIGRGFHSNAYVGSALIDMYIKCGSLEDARVIFDSLPKHDGATWNSMIGGYAQHSNYTLASQSFDTMQQAGFKPDDVTYLCLLSACSRMGLVDEGCLHFKLMRLEQGVEPTLEHYVSMVDLLGRTRFLNEAEDLLESSPFCSNAVGWTSLLGSCRTHGNVDLARQCFENAATMDPGNSTGYVLMSSIYAQAGMGEEAKRIERLRSRANVQKKPAKAFIEVEDKVHEFTVGDKTHAQSYDIYEKLKMLSLQMREEGYTPGLNFTSAYAPDNRLDKESLNIHSEKLAIAFGLISTTPGTTIRLTKNLRMCTDCHYMTKFISKSQLREIFVTDAFCVHHFKDGVCSCNEKFG